MRRRGLNHQHHFPGYRPYYFLSQNALQLHYSGLWIKGTASPPPSTGIGGGGGI